MSLVIAPITNYYLETFCLGQSLLFEFNSISPKRSPSPPVSETAVRRQIHKKRDSFVQLRWHATKAHQLPGGLVAALEKNKTENIIFA